jgi:hypothetical protein
MDARVFNLLDENGQPVGGVAAPAYDGTGARIVACPYSLRRNGLPMDAAALELVSADWPAILQATKALSGPDATVHRAWCACMALLHAPVAWDEQNGTPVPSAMSGAFKVCLGYVQTVTRMLLAREGVADERLAEQSSFDALFAQLDRDGGLLGKKYVCSGPERMIEDMWVALCGAEAELPAPWSELIAFQSRLGWELGNYGVTAARVLSGELHGRHAPWLFATTGGDPKLALRLFPKHAVPARLSSHLGL